LFLCVWQKDVWKSGGTTIEHQTKAPQVSVQDMKNRSQWMAFVRDPVDHFLSGYSECQFRIHEKRRVSELPAWNPTEYDRRIKVWLKEVKDTTQIEKIDCHIHSFPQANFLIDKDTDEFYPKVKAIGDMHELPAFLETIAKFPYNHTQGRSRVATDNHIKMNYFPNRRDLLSEQTLQEICKFVSLDYYFFDFVPPDACNKGDVLLTPQQQPPLEKQRPVPRQARERLLVQPRTPYLHGQVPLAKKVVTVKNQDQKSPYGRHQQKMKLQQLLVQQQQAGRLGIEEQQLDRQQKLLEDRLVKVKEAKEKLLRQQQQQEQERATAAVAVATRSSATENARDNRG
jgi:hypothetical protein